MPSVPTLAALRPSVAQMWRTKWTVEVLPLVPVTAAMVAGCRPAKAAAISATRRRGLASRTTTTAGSSGGRSASDAARIATAPRFTASATKAAPSGLGAGEGGEQEAGLDLARIEGQAGKNGIARQRGRGRAGVGACPHELTQQQRDALPLRVRPPSGSGRAVPAAPCAVPGAAMACARRHELRRRHWRRHAASRRSRSAAGPASGRPAGCRRATRCSR